MARVAQDLAVECCFISWVLWSRSLNIHILSCVDKNNSVCHSNNSQMVSSLSQFSHEIFIIKLHIYILYFFLYLFTFWISLGMVIGWASIWASSRAMSKSPIKWIVSMVICPRTETLVKITVALDSACSWGHWVVIYCNVSPSVTIHHFKHHSVGWAGGNGYWCLSPISALGT